jgi:mono/diheme cytochrome c family protein
MLAGCVLWAGAVATRADGQPSTAQTPAAQIALGRQLVISHVCGDCHGGMESPADPGWLQGVKSPDMEIPLSPTMILRPRNLTPDEATGTGRYTERQIFNALRYGLRPADTPDVEITSNTPGQGNFPASPHYLSPVMPWPAWRYMSDQELRAIAAYLKRGLKPVVNKVLDSNVPPDFWASEVKKPDYGSWPMATTPTKNEVGPFSAQVAEGRRLVVGHACGECHGGMENPADPGWLQGTKLPPGPFQEFPIGPFKTRPRNLTPDNTTGLGRFSERQIFNALRYGLRPGDTPDVEITSTAPGKGNFPATPHYLAPPMPWNGWKYMTDDELKAIAAYLKRGLKPAVNKVQDSDGPPDFWASEYAKAQYGSRPAVKYPTANEK